MKIIHLSDLHLGQGENWNRWKALEADLLAHLSPAEHLVVITGDLVHDATISNPYAPALAALMSLRQHNYKVFICPGNHDCGNSLFSYSKYSERFRNSFTSFLQASAPIGDATRIFPLVNIVGDLALIGLDTLEEEGGIIDGPGAEGEIGVRQLAALNRLLDHPQLVNKTRVLYLHHHPFAARHILHLLKDADSLLRIVQDRVQILLFGHNHYGLDFSSEGHKYGIPLALDGSSSTDAGDLSDRLRYRVIDPISMSYQVRFVAKNR